jgi:hypothetical protein
VSDSPFSGSIPGVSMNTGNAEATPAADGQPAQGQQPIGAPKRVQAPQRERLGSFAPHQRNASVDVAEVSEDASDPWSGLVDRNLQTQNDRLARTKPEPKNINQEAQALHDAEQAGLDAAEGETVEAVEAEVMDSEDADQEMAANYEAWKKSHEQWEALGKLDDLPDTLANKFRFITLPNGRKQRVTVQELERGYLRQNLLTQRLEEVYAFKAQLERTQRGMNAVQAALSGGNAGQFLDMITYLRAFDTFHAAALMYGEQLDKERRMDPEKKQMLHALRAAEAERQRALIEANNMRQLLAQQQSQQQQQLSPDQAYYQNQLHQMLPRAAALMEAEGTPWIQSDLSNEVFDRHMKVFAQGFDGNLTTEALKEVMVGAMQEVAEWIDKGYVPTPVPAAAKLLPPIGRAGSQPATAGQRAAQQAGAPSYANGGRAPKRARLNEITNIHRPQR